jgi:hypothetical protein
MGFDPVEAVLSATGRPNGGPASRNVAKGRPERMLAFGIDQDSVINLVAFEGIRQIGSPATRVTEDNRESVPMEVAKLD